MSLKLEDFPNRFGIEIDTGTNVCQVEIPVKTITSPNSREHPLARQRRVKAERLSTRRALIGRLVPPLPVRVTFTRVSAQLCDDDNLPTAAKAIRDEIASMYGTTDGPNGPIVWNYDQQRVKRGRFGMRVTIAAESAR